MCPRIIHAVTQLDWDKVCTRRNGGSTEIESQSRDKMVRWGMQILPKNRCVPNELETFRGSAGIQLLRWAAIRHRATLLLVGTIKIGAQQFDHGNQNHTTYLPRKFPGYRYWTLTCQRAPRFPVIWPGHPWLTCRVRD